MAPTFQCPLELSGATVFQMSLVAHTAEGQMSEANSIPHEVPLQILSGLLPAASCAFNIYIHLWAAIRMDCNILLPT